MVITKTKKNISRLKTLALHGMSKDAWGRFSDNGYKHYKVVEAGFKYNMPDLMASIGIHQLKKIEKFSIRRKQIWDLYMNEFSGLNIKLPSNINAQNKHAYHLFNICINSHKSGISRDNFLSKMNQLGIGLGVHYESIPSHPYYNKKFGWNPDDFPNSYKFGSETVSIPLSPYLSDNDLDRIIYSIKKIINVK